MNSIRNWPMMETNRFSDPAVASKLVAEIRILAGKLDKVRIMEVCGTHTMEIGRLGIRQLLPENVELISGPGCPVCVTPASYIDSTADLALSGRARIAAFGDLFRVPGNRLSLAAVRAKGAQVDIVASPRGALDIARRNPGQLVVFTAVGFETTIPATASAVRTAAGENLDNVLFYTAHRLVPPALETLLSDPSLGITAFMLPGHVSVITGEQAYRILEEHHIPGVITGFEPLDILGGICAILDMLVNGESGVKNTYTRVVRPEGNLQAQKLIDATYEHCHAMWRGIGSIPDSGLALRPEFARFDAARHFGFADDETEMPEGCACGAVMTGRIVPRDCTLFGTACTPENPVGPCMVSSEGSCAAAFRYGDR